jgi:MYXO-CTERM domain-containing protein
MLARTPELFAGGAPNAGGAAPGAAPRMRNLAVWAAHNADDTAVPPASDREMFRALSAAGSRPIYTEGAGGGHGDGHRGGATMVQWLFEQRRGMATRASRQLAFDPPGGAAQAPVTLSLTSNLAGAQIRYATDGLPPTATTGKPYAGPLFLGTSAIVTAIAVTGQGTGQVTVHHAEPYVIGAALPPDGAAPSTPPDAAPDAGSADTGATKPETDGGRAAGRGVGSCAVAATSTLRPPAWPLLAIGAGLLLARRRRRAARRGHSREQGRPSVF